MTHDYGQIPHYLAFSEELAADNPLPPVAQRLLAFSAPLFCFNGESCTTFHMTRDSQEIRTGILEAAWGIEDTENALHVSEYLSRGEGHTLFADEILRAFIHKGKFALEEGDGINIGEFGNLHDRTIRRIFNISDNMSKEAVMEHVTKLLSNHVADVLEQITAAEAGAEGKANSDAEQLAVDRNYFEGLQNDHNELMGYGYNMIGQNMLSEINEALTAYSGARKNLIDWGYTKEELEIPTMAAWDYGRAAFIARHSVKAGYITAAQAWPFIQAAANNASAQYTSWRQFLAAYIIGRALGYKNPSDNQKPVIAYLLHHPNSPYNNLPFAPPAEDIAIETFFHPALGERIYSATGLEEYREIQVYEKGLLLCKNDADILHFSDVKRYVYMEDGSRQIVMSNRIPNVLLEKENTPHFHVTVDYIALALGNYARGLDPAKLINANISFGPYLSLVDGCFRLDLHNLSPELIVDGDPIDPINIDDWDDEMPAPYLDKILAEGGWGFEGDTAVCLLPVAAVQSIDLIQDETDEIVFLNEGETSLLFSIPKSSVFNVDILKQIAIGL